MHWNQWNETIWGFSCLQNYWQILKHSTLLATYPFTKHTALYFWRVDWQTFINRMNLGGFFLYMCETWLKIFDFSKKKFFFYFYLKLTKQKEKNFHHLKFEKYVCTYDSPFCNPLAQLLLRDITIVKKEMKCFAL